MAISKVILNGTTLIDVTQDTVAAGSLFSGLTAHGSDGSSIIGTYEPSGGTIESLTVTPSTSSQIFNSDSVDGYKPVTVNAIPSQYIIPTGTIALTSNGVFDVAGYASASILVPAPVTTSYYLAQDTYGYLAYSSVAPASGSYYIVNVLSIEFSS